MAKKLFTTKNIVVMGILTAISYILYLLPKIIPVFNLPIFPSWLDIQISDLPALLGGFAINPCAAAIIIVLKCLLKLPLTTTTGVGELADVLVGLAFVLPATIIYAKNKTKKSAVIGLIAGILCSTLMAIFSNRFILIPFFAWHYGGGDADKGMNIILGAVSVLYEDITLDSFYRYYIFLAVIPFNILRGVLVAVITFFVYKPLSKALHWNGEDKNLTEENKTLNKNTPLLYNNFREVNTSSEEQTRETAKKYAETLKTGDVVLLNGDLGAGKTAFVKGVAEYFGLYGITSPTYSYLNVYGDKIYHFDFYRLSSGEDALALGLTDYFGGDNICLIEWGENVKDVLPENCKIINFEKISDNERKIIFN